MDKFLFKYFGSGCLKTCFVNMYNPNYYSFMNTSTHEEIEAFIKDRPQYVLCSTYCVWYVYLILITVIISPIILFSMISQIWESKSIKEYFLNVLSIIIGIYIFVLYFMYMFVNFTDEFNKIQ